MPYLPIDPADIGRDYEALIRVNSQSGKGGIGYLPTAHHGLRLPAPLRADFSRIVQRAADDSGAEITAKELGELFEAACPAPGDGPLTLADRRTEQVAPGVHDFRGLLHDTGRPPTAVHGTGNGPLTAPAAFPPACPADFSAAWYAASRALFGDCAS